MATLYLYIEENWPEQDDTPIPWALIEKGNVIPEIGVATTIDDLPIAEFCNLVVPASVVLLTNVEEPEKNKRLFYKSLSFAVEDHTLPNPESLHVVAGPRDVNGSVPVAVVDRQWMKNVLTKLADYGIVPNAMYVETLLAPMGEESYSIVLNGSGSFVRTGQSSGFALDDNGNDTPPVALQLVLDEDRTGDTVPGNIHVYSTNGSTPSDIGAWGEFLGVNVSERGGWNWSDSIEGSALDNINLLQGEFAPQSKIMASIPKLKPTLILLCVIALLQFGVICAEWLSLKNEARQLQSEINQSFKDAFPEAKVIVDAPLQMRRNLADLRWRAGGEDGNDLIPLFDEIAPILSVKTPVESLQYDKGILKVQVIVSEIGYVEALRDRFEKKGFDVKNIETTQKSYGLEARFTIVRKSI